MVFDEIDVGIGGMTANHIGTLLQTMADQVQLLVVTHLLKLPVARPIILQLLRLFMRVRLVLL